MKKLIVIFAAALMMTSLAAAQTTASGTLNVSATVTGSINLIFNSDAAGVALSSGEGQSTASLNFGSVSAFGVLPTGVTRTSVTANDFTVSTPVDVTVNKVNSASASYQLTAQLGTADGVNAWAASGIAFSDTVLATITSSGTYGSKLQVPLAIKIPFTTSDGTAIGNTVKFLATAN